MSLSRHLVRSVAEPSFPQTVLWIGSRRHREFVQPYGIAESLAGQIAYRATIHQAIARPATQVERIVIARPDSSRPSESEMDKLQDQFPTAQVIELTGVCCAADPPSVRLSPKRLVPWHRATQFMTEWLASNSTLSDATEESRQRRPSIAILTASYIDAEGLLQIADESNAIGIWCRSADSLVARNIDVFWWDDSVTGDRSTQRWDDLLSRVDDAASEDVTHVWLTGRPNHTQIMSARSAGVDHVISKPMRVDSLVATLGNAERVTKQSIARAA